MVKANRIAAIMFLMLALLGYILLSGILSYHDNRKTMLELSHQFLMFKISYREAMMARNAGVVLAPHDVAYRIPVKNSKDTLTLYLPAKMFHHNRLKMALDNVVPYVDGTHLHIMVNDLSNSKCSILVHQTEDINFYTDVLLNGTSIFKQAECGKNQRVDFVI